MAIPDPPIVKAGCKNAIIINPISETSINTDIMRMESQRFRPIPILKNALTLARRVTGLVSGLNI